MATVQASAKMNQPDSVWRNWRHVVVAGGFLVWIGSMALRTGAGAFVAMWNACRRLRERNLCEYAALDLTGCGTIPCTSKASRHLNPDF